MLLLADINENRLYMEYGLFFFARCCDCAPIWRLCGLGVVMGYRRDCWCLCEKKTEIVMEKCATLRNFL